ncbi:MAG TPA: hypothetical protein VJ691_01925 [Vicinamibacterales bacterium]|nr:hypothetical protein [Vicinamibacterales bacterium]
MRSVMHEEEIMEAGSTAKVWKDGRLQDASHDAALASLCRELERAMRQHQSAGVRAVILMVDQPAVARPEPAVQPVPVYVDVFESGYSQDSGYGYGV